MLSLLKRQERTEVREHLQQNHQPTGQDYLDGLKRVIRPDRNSKDYRYHSLWMQYCYDENHPPICK